MCINLAKFYGSIFKRSFAFSQKKCDSKNQFSRKKIISAQNSHNQYNMNSGS